MKKLLLILITSLMVLSTAACGGSDEPKEVVQEETSDKLVVWTLAKDLEQFSDEFMKANEGVEVETVIIEPADYPTKVKAAILGGQSEPDIIVGEPQMLQTMYDAGFFEDLNQAPYNAQDYSDKIVDYVWEVGQDADGIQRAISYQITPAGIYYRRDIAMDVFGTDDPDAIGELFKDYPTIIETATTLKDAGYRAFASDGEMNYFTGNTPWVVDGALNLATERVEYMDLAIELYTKDLTAYASAWSAPWFQAMAGEIPVLTSETNVWEQDEIDAAAESGDTTEVFAYGLPAWGTIIMRDNVKETSGLWGVASGPATGFGGGTFIGVSANSARKDLAWEYVKFCTLTESTMEWWIDASNGDTVSYIPTLEAHSDDGNAIYGDQKLYAFWLDQAQDIDYSLVTSYDTVIGDAWGSAIDSVKTGQMTKEDAINQFYDIVESTYPDVVVER
jgi:multiple sugar transport system substrate-binding protein